MPRRCGHPTESHHIISGSFHPVADPCGVGAGRSGGQGLWFATSEWEDLWDPGPAPAPPNRVVIELHPGLRHEPERSSEVPQSEGFRRLGPGQFGRVCADGGFSTGRRWQGSARARDTPDSDDKYVTPSLPRGAGAGLERAVAGGVRRSPSSPACRSAMPRIPGRRAGQAPGEGNGCRGSLWTGNPT